MKICCICKKPIKDENFLTQLIPDELYADFSCFIELIPYPVSDLTQTREQKKSQRKIEVDKIAKKLIEEYQANK